MHVAVHLPKPQVSAPQAAAPPEQVSMQAAVPAQVVVPHAPAPSHVRVQVPPFMHDSVPHTGLPAPPLHVCVQLPPAHVTFAHALTPVQVTSQFFVWQLTPRHASAPRQSTSHPSLLPQLIGPHAPAFAHVMLHFTPAGHVIAPLPVPVIVQTAGIADVSQPPLHAAGHTNASCSRASIGIMPRMQ
jgi:hypothetical protein